MSLSWYSPKVVGPAVVVVITAVAILIWIGARSFSPKLFKEGTEAPISEPETTDATDTILYKNAELGFRFRYPATWGQFQIIRREASGAKDDPISAGKSLVVSFPNNEFVAVEARTPNYSGADVSSAYYGVEDGSILPATCDIPQRIRAVSASKQGDFKRILHDTSPWVRFPRPMYWWVGYCEQLRPDAFYEILSASVGEGDPSVFGLLQTAYFQLNHPDFRALVFQHSVPNERSVKLEEEAMKVADKQVESVLKRTASPETLRRMDEFRRVIESFRFE